MNAKQFEKRRSRAKEMFRANGITVAQWAKERGFKASQVYAVLHNPEVRANHGDMHRIAIALGIKPEPSETLAVA